MSASNLAIVLSVIFIVTIIALACELLYVLWRRRTFHRHSSPPPPDQTIDVPTKELLYFFCLNPHDTPVAKLEPPDKNTNKQQPSSDDDEVVDVFKMLEAKGRPSRFLCTIKEEDKEDVESMHDVDFSNIMKPEQVVVDQEEMVVIEVDESDGIVKTVFSTPCDSPTFFTPAGSPARDFMEPEFTVSVQNRTDIVSCQVKE